MAYITVTTSREARNRVIAQLPKIIPHATISEHTFTSAGLVIIAHNTQERLPPGNRLMLEG